MVSWFSNDALNPYGILYGVRIRVYDNVYTNTMIWVPSTFFEILLFLILLRLEFWFMWCSMLNFYVTWNYEFVFCRHMLLLVPWIRIMQIFFWCFCASVRLVTIHCLSKNINPTLLEKFLLRWQRNYLGICWLIYWIVWKLPLPSVVCAMWVFWRWILCLFPLLQLAECGF